MKRVLLFGLFLTGLSIANVAWAQSSTQDQSDQSLGDYARKLKEQQGQTADHGKVYTNQDMPTDQAADAATARAGQSGDKHHLSISLPGKTWEVGVHAEGFALENDESAPGGKRRMMASNPATSVVLSIQLEQVNHQPTLEECRQYQQHRIKSFTGKFDLQDVKYRDEGAKAVVEYLIPAFQGKPVKQKNLFACFSKEDVFIDVHLSKTLYEPQDDSLMSAVMGTVYVSDFKPGSASASGPNSMALFREGSILFRQGRLRESIKPYQDALDLEKRDATLGKNVWRVLVDNLGMAYGITGDLPKAKETFDYGIGQDKGYPMFYYNLACAYAEMDNLDDAMANLKTAFENKANSIPGERMPDPRRDDSFQRFMKNEKFRELADSLAGSPK